MSDFSADINTQEEFLKSCLKDINTVVSATLGYKTNLKIRRNSGHNEYLELVDDSNIKNRCGIMKESFSNVILKSFNIFFTEKDINKHCYIELDFFYTCKDGGRNGVTALEIEIVNNFIKIIN